MSKPDPWLVWMNLDLDLGVQIITFWSSRPNTEDRKNRKRDDQKNDQMTEKAKKKHKTESTVLNLIFGPS